MSKLVPWDRYIRRKEINVKDFLSRFKDYSEFSEWFLKMGGSPPSISEVSQYFEKPKNEKPLKKVSLKKPMPTKPVASMKNTKVQLLELAAAHDVIVSYYDTKSKILQKMKKSGKFIVTLNRGR